MVTCTVEPPIGESLLQYKVVRIPCAIRSTARLASEPVGDLSEGTTIWGDPLEVEGRTWVRLSEKDAARHVADKEDRRSGCLVVEEHPKHGRLLEPLPPCGPAIRPSETWSGRGVALRVKNEYEAAIELQWRLLDEMGLVCAEGIDRDSARPKAIAEVLVGHSGAEGAYIRRVDAGRDSSLTIQHMPVGGQFLISVVLELPDGSAQLRSPWARANTLTAESRRGGAGAGRGGAAGGEGSHSGVAEQFRSLDGNLDPTGQARGSCNKCSCASYVPVSRRFDSISAFFNCRRCACHANDHERIELRTPEDERRLLQLIERQDAERVEAEERADELRRKLRQMEDAAKQRLGRAAVCCLPREAVEWDARDVDLWYWSSGQVHPREHPHAARARQLRHQVERGQAADTKGLFLRPGRVSVVTPTTESRHEFHSQLWQNFCEQTWPDKELIVVESFEDRPSPFFTALDGTDERLIYLGFKHKKDSDLSTGAKRNIGQHLATGEYVANFDDDDLYAPRYLDAMLKELETLEAGMITLSAWYVCDRRTSRFTRCDPWEYAQVNGMSPSDPCIQHWLWGYGFSYVYRLRPALEGDLAYPESSMGEDLEFMQAFKRAAGKSQAVLLADTSGLCLHVLHGGNQSSCFCVGEVELEEALSLEVGGLVRQHLLRRMFPRAETGGGGVL